MPQIRFDKVSVGYAQTLFKNITLSISSHDRIGIVGHNGCGKSTFLRCIAGLVEPHAGRILCPKGLTFGFIEQEIPKNIVNKTLWDAISLALPDSEKDYSSWKVDVTLDSFNAPMNIRQKPLHELSGGWQRLALIARTVLSSPDVLLLDEPTNHLDLEKIMVLERWLNEQVGDLPLVTVSHDRRFLEHCTNKTFFLRGEDIREYRYSYARAVELLRDDDSNAHIARSKEVKEMQRLKRSAHELRQIGINNYSAAALKKSNQIAKRAEGIEMQLPSVHVEAKRDLKLNHSGIHNKQLMTLQNVSICSPDGVKLFHIETLTIQQGDRLVVFGKNGSGKSQLLKMLHEATLNKERAKQQGILVVPALALGYIDQHMAHLPLHRVLHDYINETLSLGAQKTTTILVGAGFPVAIQQTPLARLSPGQRTRVAFLVLHWLEPNFYIMDEPTNHLDIAGQEQLELEIVKKNATSVIVSHDRSFTDEVGTVFFMIKNKRLVKINTPSIYYQSLEEGGDAMDEGLRKR